MLNHQEFVSKGKSMLIAPAGFGKTHTIAECLKTINIKGKQLILTHTHAGVASIREKIKKEGIPNSSFEVETITSFAQKYVMAFYTGNDIPEQENSKLYIHLLFKKRIYFLSLNQFVKLYTTPIQGYLLTNIKIVH